MHDTKSVERLLLIEKLKQCRKIRKPRTYHVEVTVQVPQVLFDQLLKALDGQ